MTYNIAVLGATGLVGETLLSILEERLFPVKKIYALGSERSAGTSVLFKKKKITIENAAGFDFSKVDIAFFSAGGKVSAQYAPIATKAGCVVIDNTSYFRYEADVPLIVPEVNPEMIGLYKKRRIIANPNCSTAQLMVALKPLYDAVGIKKIHVCTYQSVSGSGRAGLEELETQTRQLFQGQAIKPAVYSTQIAFNVVPGIDVFLENGYTKEEMKVVWETRKILNDLDIEVNVTAVRVPVFYGHSEAVHVETIEEISAVRAKEILREAPGLVLMEDDGTYPTPVSEGSQVDAVYVGRVREDLSCTRGLNLWVVADNVRKGAALNAVQIAEVLVEKYGNTLRE